MNGSTRTSAIFQSDTLALLLTALFFAYISANVVGALVILCALAYLLVTVVVAIPCSTDRIERIVSTLRLTIIAVAVCLLVVVPTVMFMIQRARAAPHEYAQDSLLQIEAAARFFLAGQNPYVVNYLDTPMADWGIAESGSQNQAALYHFVYTPLAFLSAVPGEAIVRPLTGWYDHRIVLLLCYLVNLGLVMRLADSSTAGRTLLVIFGLNPLLLTSYTYGNIDTLVLMGWLLTYLLATRRRWTWAFLALGLTVATKQLSAIAVPFLVLYWLSVERPRAARQIADPVLALVAPVLLLIGPFFLWNPRAFIEDTVLFVVGGLSDSYPVMGMSLQAMLPASPTITAILSVMRWAVLVPLLALTSYLTWRLRSLRATLAFQTVVFAVAIFFSRFVNVQYVGYLIIQVALSLWIRKLDDRPQQLADVSPAASDLQKHNAP
jgi:hypothetical protein